MPFRGFLGYCAFQSLQMCLMVSFLSNLARLKSKMCWPDSWRRFSSQYFSLFHFNISLSLALWWLYILILRWPTFHSCDMYLYVSSWSYLGILKGSFCSSLFISFLRRRTNSWNLSPAKGLTQASTFGRHSGGNLLTCFKGSVSYSRFLTTVLASRIPGLFGFSSNLISNSFSSFFIPGVILPY